eukprot:Nitzschia sp. Nitz4//scaffold28_size193895//163172//163894//NITZ4_001685-RA/size193895-processed-gene-0.82-mRNA-1//-1//CDS//3329546042//3804//frame0
MKAIPTLLALLLFIQGVKGLFEFQRDTKPECAEASEEWCAQDPTRWLTCPMACPQTLEREGAMAEVHQDPEAFFQIPVESYPPHSHISSLEDQEGYVTLFAVLPLKDPGMANFYRNMLEHVANVFPYTIQTIILPWIELEGDHDSNDTPMKQTISQWKPSKRLLMLEPTPRVTQALDYLVQAPLAAGNPDATLAVDRVTVFLVSMDGVYIERLVSPTMTLLERRASVFLQQLDKIYSPDL